MTVSGQQLTRNTAFNLVGQGIPLVVGVSCLPGIVGGLGTNRFGLLGIAWAILGYFTFLDLGMSRASTRFVADALGRGEHHRIPKIVWAAASIQVGIGVAGSLVLLGVAPFLARSFLRVPDELLRETLLTFRVLAPAVPVVLLSASFRGVLEASQRFGLVNAVAIPAGSLNFIIPLVGALRGWSLPFIVVALVAARVAVFVAHGILAARVLPALKGLPKTDKQAIRAIVPFGAWAAVSNLLSPVMDSLDRLLVGAFLGIGAAGYYTAPQDLVLRLRVAPTSLAAALFPAFASAGGGGDHVGGRGLYGQAMRYLLLLLTPGVLALILLAPDLLTVWLGDDFGAASGRALQLLLLGFLANAVAYVPFAFLHAVNRPDIPAKLHAIEFPIFLALAWTLIPSWGITGAAAVWTTRTAIDVALLLLAASRAGARSGGLLPPHGAAALMTLAALGLALAIFFPLLPGGLAARLGYAAAAAAGSGVALWGTLLHPADRGAAHHFARALRARR